MSTTQFQTQIEGEALQLRIGQLASLVGVTPKTIRHYHKIGLLPKPQRGDNDYRLYGVADLYRLKLVLRLKEVGFSLADIRKILHSEDPDSSLRERLHTLEGALTGQIIRLERQREEARKFLAEERSLSAFDQPETHESLTHQFLIEILTEYADCTPDRIQSLDKALLARLDAFQWGEEYRAYWEQIARSLSQQLEPFQKANELFAASMNLEIGDPELDILADEIAGQLQRLQSVFTLPNLEKSLHGTFKQVAVRSLQEVLTPTQQHLIGLIRNRLNA